jgi:hypothetical protein
MTDHEINRRMAEIEYGIELSVAYTQPDTNGVESWWSNNPDESGNQGNVFLLRCPYHNYVNDLSHAWRVALEAVKPLGSVTVEFGWNTYLEESLIGVWVHPSGDTGKNTIYAQNPDPATAICLAVIEAYDKGKALMREDA